ncbi:UNVERIFIED_CONTAM: hypothetical protein K2H54_002107 [Gekko kuhli]
MIFRSMMGLQFSALVLSPDLDKKMMALYRDSDNSLQARASANTRTKQGASQLANHCAGGSGGCLNAPAEHQEAFQHGRIVTMVTVRKCGILEAQLVLTVGGRQPPGPPGGC